MQIYPLHHFRVQVTFMAAPVINSPGILTRALIFPPVR
jgi:hypothetical protein